MTAPRRAGLASLLAFASAACGVRTGLLDAHAGDAAVADAIVDLGVDAPQAACDVARAAPCASWSLGAPAPLQIPLVSGVQLRELAGDCDGAWLLADARTVDADQAVTVIARLDRSGQLAAPKVHLVVPARVATLAVDFASKRAGVFAEGVAGSAYGFMRLDAAEYPNGAFAPLSLASGFSLAGAREGAAGPAGFSFFAEQVRALWGLERISVGLDGAYRDRLVLDVPEDVGLTGAPVYARIDYDDGAYTALWLDRQRGGRDALYYDAAERPSAVTRYRSDTDPAVDLAVTATPEGFVDAYREALGAESAQLDFRDRRGAMLRRARKPAAFASTLRGFSMAFTRGALLLVGQGGSGVPLLELETYSYAKDALAPAVVSRLKGTFSASRTVATGAGALVVGDDGPGGLWSAAITCR